MNAVYLAAWAPAVLGAALLAARRIAMPRGQHHGGQAAPDPPGDGWDPPARPVPVAQVLAGYSRAIDRIQLEDRAWQYSRFTRTRWQRLPAGQPA